ncbi:hypothetical protein C8R45DRAFT_806234 [Mycena sanguinolenta]|nr:hypothetical protein C8R45DRAFT_806234 [Mycena sanguinolenta]
MAKWTLDTHFKPHPSERLRFLHLKAWGHQWPRHKSLIEKDELGDLVNDDELYFADETRRLEYVCLDGIGQITTALMAPLYLQDSIVIRDEYEFVREKLDQAQLSEEQLQKRLFTITGHPGIGKTCFLLYLLLCRLERRLPTAIQISGREFFIFDAHGATVHQTDISFQDITQAPDATHLAIVTRLESCWALCDINSAVKQPCDRLLAAAQRIVVTTSPKPERWKEIHRQLSGNIIIMDLPTILEIGAAVKEVQPHSLSSTLGILTRWGLSLRTIFSLIQQTDNVSNKEVEAEAAATALANDDFTNSVTKSSIGMLPTHKSGSLLFLSLNAERRPILTIPTKYLADIFDTSARKLQAKRAFELFCLLSTHSLTRTATGWMHEKAMHERMMEGRPIEVQGQNQKSSTPITMPTSSNFLCGTLGGLKNVRSSASFYWLPSVVNFPGIDAVLGDLQNIWTFQSTTGDTHVDPTPGIRKAWEVIAAECRQRCWNLVVVGDDEGQVKTVLDKFSWDLANFTLGEGKKKISLWWCVLHSS